MNENEIRERIKKIYEDYISSIVLSMEELGLKNVSEKQLIEQYKIEIEALEAERKYLFEIMYNIVVSLLKEETELHISLFTEFTEYCYKENMESLCIAFDYYIAELIG